MSSLANYYKASNIRYASFAIDTSASSMADNLKSEVGLTDSSEYLYLYILIRLSLILCNSNVYILFKNDSLHILFHQFVKRIENLIELKSNFNIL